MALLASDKYSTNIMIKTPIQSYNLILKPFPKIIFEIFKPLLTISGVSLKRTLNTNWKKLEIIHLTFNSSNLF